LIWGCPQIAPLKPDCSGFAGLDIKIGPSDRKLGHEGCTIRKIGNKYVLFGTAWSTDTMRHGTYNLYYCTADRVTGPYGPRENSPLNPLVKTWSANGRWWRQGHGQLVDDVEGNWWMLYTG